MNLITSIAKELFGLFVDDGSLAVGILVLVGFLAAAMSLALPPVLTGPLLFLGCATLLAENVRRTLGRQKR